MNAQLFFQLFLPNSNRTTGNNNESNVVGYVAFANAANYQQISTNSFLRTNYYPNIGLPFISGSASGKGIRIVNSAYHTTPTGDQTQNHVQVTDLNFNTFQVTNSQDNIGFEEWNDNWHVNYVGAHVNNFGLYASTFGGSSYQENNQNTGKVRTRIQIQGNPIVDPFNLLRKRFICAGDSIELILKNYNLPGSYFWFANECCDTIKGYGRTFKYKSLAGSHSVRVVYRDTSGAEMFFHFCILPKTKAKVVVNSPTQVCTDENPVITVSGNGSYSFSVNGGAFQTHSSPFSANLTLPGDNYVTIRNLADTSLFCQWDTTILIRKVNIDLQMSAGQVACGQDSVTLTLNATLIPSNISIQGITYTIQRQSSSNEWVTVYQGPDPIQTVSVDILNALTSSPELIRNFRAFATLNELGCSDSASANVSVPINPYISRPYIQLVQNGAGIVNDTIIVHNFPSDSVTNQVYDVWLCANTPTKIDPYNIKVSPWFDAFSNSGTPPYDIWDETSNQKIDIHEPVSVGAGQNRIYKIVVRSKTGCLSLPTKIRLIGVGSAMGELEASDTKTCVGSEIYVNFKGMFYLGNLGTKKWNHPGAELVDSTNSPVNGRHLRFNSPGIYTITFTVHRQGCDQTFEKTIEVEGEPILGYCCSRSYNTGPFPQNTSGMTESELGTIGEIKKLIGTPESPIVFSGKYHVIGSLLLSGKVIFLPNTQFYIDGADINEQAGPFENCKEPFSKIIYPFINFSNGSVIEINSTTFQSSCAGMWQGLIISPGCRFTMKGSTVNDAIAGITWTGRKACEGSEYHESKVQISKSNFGNNLIGILAENISDPSVCRIDSNFFVNQRWGLKLPFYNENSLRYIPLCGIAFHQPDYDKTNFESMSLTNNVFEEMKLGMAGLRPTMRIFRNHFKNCHKAAMTTYDFRLNPPTFPEQLSEPLYLENNTIELPDHRWFETSPLEGFSPLELEAEHLQITRPTASANLTGEPNVYGILSNAPLWVQGTPGRSFIRGFSEKLPAELASFPEYRMTPRTTFGIYSQLMDAESLTQSGYSADKLIVNGYQIDSVKYGIYGFKVQTNPAMKSPFIEIENNWFRLCDTAFSYNKWNTGTNMQPVPLLLRGNKVDSCRVSFNLDHLGTASPTKLTFTCNDLRYAKKESSNYPHIGLLLKSGFRLTTNIAGNGVIGGPGGSNENENPNSNVWPILNHPSREHNPCSTTDDAEGCTIWISPSNWISVNNQTGEKVVYYRFKNEFLGEISPPITQGTPLKQLATSKCFTENNIPVDTTNYVQVCSDITDLDDPVFPVRPGAPAITSVKQELSDCFMGNPVPNPASGLTIFQYRLPKEWIGHSTLEIVEVGTGKLVDSKSIGETHGELALDVSRFPAGVYVCRIRNQQSLIWKWRKLVVVK